MLVGISAGILRAGEAQKTHNNHCFSDRRESDGVKKRERK